MGSFFSHLGSMWLRPKDTMRSIIAQNPPEWVLLLYVIIPQIFAIVLYVGTMITVMKSVFPPGSDLPTELFMEFKVYIIGYLLFCVVMGLAMVYITGYIFKCLAKWVFRQDVPAKNSRLAIAWYAIGGGLLMLIYAIPFILSSIIGGEVGTGIMLVGTGIMSLLIIIPGIWLFFLFFHFVAAAHNLRSAWGGLGLSLLSGILGGIIFSVIFGSIFGALYESDFVENMTQELTQKFEAAGTRMMQDPAFQDQLQEQLQNVDWENVDLEGLENIEGLEGLGDLDLEGIDFENIDLSEVNLDEIDLSEIDQADVDAYKASQGN